MAINNISSNPILNSPTYQKTQTRETTNDSALDNQNRSSDTTTASGQPTQDDGVLLNLGTQTMRAERTQEPRPMVSPREAERTANSLRQMMNDDPQQAAQAFGMPDNRMVQSLLAAA